jgi:glycerate kinase
MSRFVFRMPDLGEGTVEAMVAATGGRRLEVAVTGPLGVPVQAKVLTVNTVTATVPATPTVPPPAPKAKETTVSLP